MGTGVAAALAGLFLMLVTQFAGPGTQETSVNPFSANQESIGIGQRVYEQSRQACHGATGVGVGPMGAGLQSPPLNLRVHVPLHGDSELFHFIADGLSGTAMRAWRGRISDEGIWRLVNYIKTSEHEGRCESGAPGTWCVSSGPSQPNADHSNPDRGMEPLPLSSWPYAVVKVVLAVANVAMMLQNGLLFDTRSALDYRYSPLRRRRG